MKFLIKDFELGGHETEVSAPGMAEAMFEYLPWPTLDLLVRHVPSRGFAEVTDRQTDFRYDVQAI